MAEISNQYVYQRLADKFGAGVSVPDEPYGMLTLEVSGSVISDVLFFLKKDPELNFHFLTDITAIHYPEKELGICVVYHLHSFRSNVRIRLKVYVNEREPSIPTATNLWEGANWMERETYDFFGVNFVGHPNLKRILNMDDMTVFPMRKEYPLEDPNRADKKDFFFGR